MVVSSRKPPKEIQASMTDIVVENVLGEGK
jgi:hypothetical protein